MGGKSGVFGGVRGRTAHTNAWAVVNAHHSGHAAHVHAQAFLSGVDDVQAPEGCGNLYFLDPRTVPVMASLPVTQATL